MEEHKKKQQELLELMFAIKILDTEKLIAKCVQKTDKFMEELISYTGDALNEYAIQQGRNDSDELKAEAEADLLLLKKVRKYMMKKDVLQWMEDVRII